MRFLKHFRQFHLGLLMMILATLACTRGSEPETIIVTATPAPGIAVVAPSDTPNRPTDPPIIPTPNPTREIAAALSSDGTYLVQQGDTLAEIAARFGTDLNTLIALNNISNPNLLETNQILQIPGRTIGYASSFKIIPDSELVFSPTSAGFDVAAYTKLKSGFLRVYSEDINGDLWSGVELINEIAMHFSVNPRILLALLEYQSGWLSQSNITEQNRIYPLGIVKTGRENLFRQLRDTADILNKGYYDWRYRSVEAAILPDGSAVLFAPEINAGTAAIQYFFSQVSTNRAEWDRHISEQGFFQIYLNLFGDPFRSAIEPLVPNDLQQPSLIFPFPKNETWFYTGGPHGAYASGSAWAAVDFAPPEPPADVAQQGSCYLSPNYVTAVAPGIIARSGRGYVVLDLDFDGNEHTGWTVVYLHIDSRGVIAPGTRVTTGDKLGFPSCEGGVSTGTHLHISRRYNGEWIPAQCNECSKDVRVPAFTFGSWTVWGLAGDEYQGGMKHVSGTVADRVAQVGRNNPNNQVSN